MRITYRPGCTICALTEYDVEWICDFVAVFPHVEPVRR